MAELISVVVPTYNEMHNVHLVAERLHEALSGMPHEVIFVDDSTDDTPAVLSRLAAQDPQVRVEHREGVRGLGTAVVRGFELARGQILAVMDGDLQHPPEVLPRLVAALDGTLQTAADQGPTANPDAAPADIAIASRFVPGGGDGGLNPWRRLVSGTARLMSRVALSRVRAIQDPTSGCFALRREVVEGVALHPTSWKILVEVLVRGRYRRVREVPYSFDARLRGQSKMDSREMLAYMGHLARLVATSPEDRRLALFAAVGASGYVLNLLVYAGLMGTGSPAVPAAIVSAALAMTSNFILNDRFTWRDVRHGTAWGRFVRFAATSAIGIGVNVGVLFVLHNLLGVAPLLANAAGILCGAAGNFLLSDRWTWGGTRPAPAVIPASSESGVPTAATSTRQPAGHS